MREAPTDWLDHSARTHPDTVALAGGGETLNFAELREQAGSLAAALAGVGVGIGDPVAIDLPAGIPHAVALHGAILAGAVVQSLPPAGRDGVEVAPGATYLDGDWVDRARARDEAWPSFARHPASLVVPISRDHNDP